MPTPKPTPKGFRAFLRRLLGPAMIDAPPQRRGNYYAGAAQNRLTADITARGLHSVGQEVRGDLAIVRARARDLGRNDAYGARFLALCEENVIGPFGIGLQARNLNAAGKLDVELNKTIERAFKYWGRPECCSADRRLSWIAQQRLAIRTKAQDGEALVRMLPGFDNEYGFAIQQLDPDQLDHTYNRPAARGMNEIRFGIEIDQWGATVAYHCWSSHPSDSRWDRRRIRIAAEHMVHLFLVKRPGQMRGIPWAAPVMIPAHMLNGFQEAYLVACRVGASKMGFFSRKDDEEPSLDEQAKELSMDASPGSFEDISGYEFHEWNPDYPSSGYPDFIKSMLRTQATGYNVSYNTLANDLEGVNYSSIRAGLITERDSWRVLQVATIEHLHERIYPVWLKWAVTVGALRLPSMDYREFLEHAWMPRGWQWVDPLKDALAFEKLISLGMESRTRGLSEQGRDFADTLDDLKNEQELATDAGVSIFPAPTAGDRERAAQMFGLTEDDDPPAKRNGTNRLSKAARP